MEHYRIYHPEIPAFLSACAETPSLQRLMHVGMNCGCEYTSFPRFRGLLPYSRFDHSIGAALIVWHFTHDEKQAVAALLHDVATPVFAHVVDFLKGDYFRQEATESGTEAIIASDAALQRQLSLLGLSTEDVSDYHRYPVADNDSPQLSADRLEYTLGNLLNYRIRTQAQVQAFYDDLFVGTDGDGRPELVFRTEETAIDFAKAALVCSKIYVSDEDRYAMQILSELLGYAIRAGVLSEDDLYRDEPAVIAKLGADAKTAAAWRNFRSCRTVLCADEPQAGGVWRQIAAKKRYIDPLIANEGRVTAVFEPLREEIGAFLEKPQTEWIAAAEAQPLPEE